MPLLNSPTPNVIRDACRTLAVLGNKDLVPSIEPLLKHADKKVQADAQDAIYKLKQKA
jgi:HEAT repeat protein